MGILDISNANKYKGLSNDEILTRDEFKKMSVDLVQMMMGFTQGMHLDIFALNFVKIKHSK